MKTTAGQNISQTAENQKQRTILHTYILSGFLIAGSRKSKANYSSNDRKVEVLHIPLSLALVRPADQLVPTFTSLLTTCLIAEVQDGCVYFLATTPLNLSLLVTSDCYNKIPQVGWLKQQIFYFSQVWRLESPRSRCWPIQFLVRTLFLACRWLCLRAESSSGGKKEHSSVSSSSYKDTNPTMKAPLS